MLVPTNMSLVGSALLARPVLDLEAMTKMWDLVPPNHMTIVAVTLVNLAPVYFSPGVIFSQFGMLSERVWAFQRCAHGQLQGFAAMSLGCKLCRKYKDTNGMGFVPLTAYGDDVLM